VTDLAGRAVDTHAELKDGTKFEDLSGLRDHVMSTRRDAFVTQFCRKLLGYALARPVQLSDEPLLAEMRARLSSNGYRVNEAILAILRSPQFRMSRGMDSTLDRENIHP
jgi:hypothetical protein